MSIDELFSNPDWFLASVFAVFLRVGGIVSVAPGFSDQAVSVRSRLIIAIVLTFICFGGLEDPRLFKKFELPSAYFWLLAELLIGLILGLALRYLIFALQLAGTIAAQAMSLSQLLGGAQEEPLPTIGYILSFAALAALMASEFHVKVAVFLIESYTWLPVGKFPAGQDVINWGLLHAGAMFEQALVLAAPFLLVSMLYNLTLGVINKAMPQLMVALVGAPAITLAAIALLAVTGPIILNIWLSSADSVLSSPSGFR